MAEGGNCTSIGIHPQDLPATLETALGVLLPSFLPLLPLRLHADSQGDFRDVETASVQMGRGALPTRTVVCGNGVKIPLNPAFMGFGNTNELVDLIQTRIATARQ